jgi:hypothetical protein
VEQRRKNKIGTCQIGKEKKGKNIYISIELKANSFFLPRATKARTSPQY